MSGRFALVIGNTEYTDPGLAVLTAPGKDATDFARVLGDHNLCAFDEVKTLLNQPSSSAIEVVDEFFGQRKPDDLIVLYFSGHGVRDEFGSLYLAFKNTVRSRLRSTAVKSDYIREAMDQSRSRRQVLILDCCNSGAFPQGTKAEAGGPMGVLSAFQGYGRYVLTASDATQFAWEGNQVIGNTENSLFTHFLVKGLEGEADNNGDGKITVDELYDYAFEQVSKVTPRQTPTKSASKQEGEIVLREITRLEDIRAVALPGELIDATEDSRPYVREGAVQELEKLLRGKNFGLACAARTTLEKLAGADDSSRIRQAAALALAANPATQKKAAEPKNIAKVPERQAVPRMKPVLVDAPVGTESGRIAEDIPLATEEAEAKRQAEAGKLAAVRAKISTLADLGMQKPADAQPAVEGPYDARRLTTSRWVLIGATALVVTAVILIRSSLSPSAVPSSPPAEPTQTTSQPPPTLTPQPEITAPPALAEPLALAGTPLPFKADVITADNAAKVIPLARWGKGRITDIAYSPKGNLLAVGSSLGIYLYKADTLQQISLLDAAGSTEAIAFSPDGQALATANTTDVSLWNVSDGTLLQTLRGHTGSITAVAFSPDGQTIASGSIDGTVRLWRASDGTPLQTLEGHAGNIETVAFSPDSRTLASGSDDKTVRLWRVSDGTLLQTLQGHTDVVFTATFSPDGQILASGARDNTIRLWRVSDGALIRTLLGHTSFVMSLAFSPDGKTVASAGSWDNTIRIWRISDGIQLRTLWGGAGTVFKVAFSPDGQTLASAPYDGKMLQFWRAADGTLLQSLPGHISLVDSVAFSPDGKTLASGEWDGTVRLWRARDGTVLTTLQKNIGSVWSVAFSPDGTILASDGPWDHAILLYRVSDGSILHTLEGHTDTVEHVAFSPDGQTLVSGSDDKTVRLWRVSDGSLLRTLQGHTDVVFGVAFSPDGQTVASGSFDSTVRLWNVTDGALIRVLQGHKDKVYGVVFSPDGQTLASGSDDRTVRLWRVNTGDLMQSLDVSDRSSCLAFSPDGQVLASGEAWSKTIRLWRVSDGNVLTLLQGHTNYIDAIAFSPDGTMLASGSTDNTIRLWGARP